MKSVNHGLCLISRYNHARTFRTLSTAHLAAAHRSSIASEKQSYVVGHRQKTTTARNERLDQLANIKIASSIEKPSQTESRYPNIRLTQSQLSRSQSSHTSLQSTRPADLDNVQPPNPNPDGSVSITSRGKYYFSIGKSYLKFFKTGFKHIWTNYQEMSAVRQRIAPYSLEYAVKYGGQMLDNTSAATVPTISRRDYQLCHRTRHDLFTLIPFSLIFIVCGEFTPLVVLALGSSVVPYTCRIPRLQLKDRYRLIAALDRSNNEKSKLNLSEASSGSTNRTVANNRKHDWRQLCVDAYRLGLTSVPTPLPIFGMLWHKLVTERRLKQRCSEILCDTILIHREGGFKRLSYEELIMYGERYGSRTFVTLLKDMRQRGLTGFTPEMVRKLTTTLESEAHEILNQDWTRLNPDSHWMIVYQQMLKTDSLDYRQARQLQNAERQLD